MLFKWYSTTGETRPKPVWGARTKMRWEALLGVAHHVFAMYLWVKYASGFCYRVSSLKFHHRNSKSPVLLPLGFYLLDLKKCLKTCWHNQRLGHDTVTDCSWHWKRVMHVWGISWVRPGTVALCMWLIVFLPHFSTNKGLSSKLIRIVVLLYFFYLDLFCKSSCLHN